MLVLKWSIRRKEKRRRRWLVKGMIVMGRRMGKRLEADPRYKS
jgi:hypothetical protein